MGDEVSNAITAIGMDAVVALLGKDLSQPSLYDSIGVGEGTTAAAVGDTALGSETAREGATGTGVTTTQTHDTLQLAHTFAAGTFSGETISEAGVFNALSGGSMLSRCTFTGVGPLGASDTLAITYQIQIKQGA